MDWVITRFRKPPDHRHYDVTLEEPGGSRLWNVAIYQPLQGTWELLIDKHNYQDCKVVAWRERMAVYEGKV